MQKAITVIFLFGLMSIAYGQDIMKKDDGIFFTSSKETYFKNVIEPWKYYLKQSSDVPKDAIPKNLGIVEFYRSENFSQRNFKNWKPSIEYTIYSIEDSSYCRKFSGILKADPFCDSLNRGGDYIELGNFILLSKDRCVNCSLDNKVDYCRNIVRRLLESINDKNKNNIAELLDQLPVKQRRRME